MNDILIPSISLILGLIIGFFSSYFKEKGKNLALIEDLKELTDEKEKISSEYQLEIAKRKYQYEDKRTQYFKYFHLLDELDAEGIKSVTSEFLPAMKTFNEEFLKSNNDNDKMTVAITKFSNSVNNLMIKSTESYIKIKRETKTIKLVAGDTVLQLLQEIELNYSDSLTKSSEMMKELSHNIISGNQESINSQQKEIEVIANNINDLKEQLISEVRKELGEM